MGPTHLARGHQDGARAFAARAPGAPAAVGVRVRVAGRLHVEHQRHVGHVDAARRDVGGDEDAQHAALEAVERLGALALGHLAGDGGHAEARVRERRLELGHPGARLGEDQGARFGVGEEEVDERVEALVRIDEVEDVLDVRVRGAEPGALEVQRALLDPIGQVPHVRGERRRHQVGAPGVRALAQDLLDALREAHVEHPVGLVQHHAAHLASVDRPLIEVIDEAAGRGDDDVGVLGERAVLVLVAGAAGDRGDLQAQGPEEPGQLFFDLTAELAGGRDDERAGPGVLGALGGGHVGARPHEPRREHEADGDGLARAGLRGDAEVAGLPVGAEDGSLDGGQGRIALGLECCEELGT